MKKICDTYNTKTNDGSNNMKRIVAFIIAVLIMVSLCACGTTEKWLLTKEIWSEDEVTYTYTYDDRGNVIEILETDDYSGEWFKTHMHYNTIESFESNYNELYAAEGYEMAVQLDTNNKYTMRLYYGFDCYREITNTLNDQRRIIHTEVIDYNNGEKRIIDRKYDANNLLIETDVSVFDYNTGELLSQHSDNYYCTYDSTGMPTSLYYVGDNEYDEPQCQLIWYLTEIKK